MVSFGLDLDRRWNALGPGTIPSLNRLGGFFRLLFLKQLGLQIVFLLFGRERHQFEVRVVKLIWYYSQVEFGEVGANHRWHVLQHIL